MHIRDIPHLQLLCTYHSQSPHHGGPPFACLGRFVTTCRSPALRVDDKQLLECTVFCLSTTQMPNCVIQSWGDASFNRHFLLFKGCLLFDLVLLRIILVSESGPTLFLFAKMFRIRNIVVPRLLRLPKRHNLNVFAFRSRFWGWKTHGTAIPNWQCYKCIALPLPDEISDASYDTMIARPRLQYHQWTHIRRIIEEAGIVLAEIGRFIPQGVISHWTARSALLRRRPVIPTWDNCASRAGGFDDILKEGYRLTKGCRWLNAYRVILSCSEPYDDWWAARSHLGLDCV